MYGASCAVSFLTLIAVVILVSKNESTGGASLASSSGCSTDASCFAFIICRQSYLAYAVLRFLFDLVADLAGSRSPYLYWGSNWNCPKLRCLEPRGEAFANFRSAQLAVTRHFFMLCRYTVLGCISYGTCTFGPSGLHTDW